MVLEPGEKENVGGETGEAVAFVNDDLGVFPTLFVGQSLFLQLPCEAAD